MFTADVNLATAALESAKKEQPSIEGEFEVFSRCRGLQQKRQVRLRVQGLFRDVVEH